MIFSIVIEDLALGLKSVDLHLYGKVLGQLRQLDQVGKVKVDTVQPVEGAHHLGRDDLAPALHQTEEVVDKGVHFSASQLVHKLLGIPAIKGTESQKTSMLHQKMCMCRNVIYTVPIHAKGKLIIRTFDW